MKRMVLVGFLAVAAASACGPEPKVVRQSDLEAWRQVPVIELESHAFFSTVPLNKRRLSDGSEMWVFSNCQSTDEDVHCRTTSSVFGVDTRCGGGGTSRSCCHNQFIVRNGWVESYRPVGNCYTNCGVRPLAT